MNSDDKTVETAGSFGAPVTEGGTLEAGSADGDTYTVTVYWTDGTRTIFSEVTHHERDDDVLVIEGKDPDDKEPHTHEIEMSSVRRWKVKS